MKVERNYWGFRACNDPKIREGIIYPDIQKGKLRQGWGYAGTDLRYPDKLDAGARRNLPIFNKVKKEDILLIAKVPEWGDITIVEATEDFNTGYNFEFPKELNDFGHIFPVKFLVPFNRNNKCVDSNIRSTFKSRSRFWNINACSESIERLLTIEESELNEAITPEDRLESCIEEVFEESIFKEKLHKKICNSFNAAEWEKALVYGLQKLYPDYEIDTTVNKIEKKHGADILIKIPGLFGGYEYVIAVQVKDYKGVGNDEAIKQIAKSDSYDWDGLKLIDKIVIYTGVEKDEEKHKSLIENKEGVKVLFANELKDLLCEIGRKFIGDNSKI